MVTTLGHQCEVTKLGPCGSLRRTGAPVPNQHLLFEGAGVALETNMSLLVYRNDLAWWPFLWRPGLIGHRCPWPLDQDPLSNLHLGGRIGGDPLVAQGPFLAPELLVL